MSYNPGPYGDNKHPYGLPMGTVRGFLSLLICSFFWIYLLLPEAAGDRPNATAPLAHFFLLTLVFLSFASHPVPRDPDKSEFLPWLMRFLFVGGSVAVVAYVAYLDPTRLRVRLTPEPSEVGMWPVLLATLSGGFGAGLVCRRLFGRQSDLFLTVRGWVGVVATLLLVAETVLQFLILPALSDAQKPSFETMKVWEGTVNGFVAFYFGTRA